MDPISIAIGAGVARRGLEMGGHLHERSVAFRQRHPVLYGTTTATLILLGAFGAGLVKGAFESADGLFSTSTEASASGGQVTVDRMIIPEDIVLAGVETTVEGSHGQVEEVVEVLGYRHQTSLIESFVNFRALTEVVYPASSIETERYWDGDRQAWVKRLIFDYRQLAIKTQVQNGSVWSKDRAEGEAGLRQIAAAIAETTNTDEYRPFGLDPVGVDESNAEFNVTRGAAIREGLRRSDECVNSNVVPYATEIFTQGAINAYGGIVGSYGDEIEIAFVNGPEDASDPASIPSIPIETASDPRLEEILASLDVEAEAGTGVCLVSPTVAKILDESVAESSANVSYDASGQQTATAGGRN